LVPAGLTLRIVRWDKEDLHNRYVLTERGGLKFGQGLDEGTNPPTDVVNLLGERVHEEIWKDYDRTVSTLRLIDEWEVK
jgi:hypothetical protein